MFLTTYSRYVVSQVSRCACYILRQVNSSRSMTFPASSTPFSHILGTLRENRRIKNSRGFKSCMSPNVSPLMIPHRSPYTPLPLSIHSAILLVSSSPSSLIPHRQLCRPRHPTFLPTTRFLLFQALRTILLPYGVTQGYRTRYGEHARSLVPTGST